MVKIIQKSACKYIQSKLEDSNKWENMTKNECESPQSSLLLELLQLTHLWVEFLWQGMYAFQVQFTFQDTLKTILIFLVCKFPVCLLSRWMRPETFLKVKPQDCSMVKQTHTYIYLYNLFIHCIIMGVCISPIQY